MQVNISYQKVFRHLKFYYFSWSSRTSGSWRISTGKLSKHVFKNTLAKHYKTLQRAYISKTQKLILIYTENNIYLNSSTKFLLNNRQPSKYWKFNRQPSKLPSNWDPHEKSRNKQVKCPYNFISKKARARDDILKQLRIGLVKKYHNTYFS